jgi:hypothetical protein
MNRLSRSLSLTAVLLAVVNVHAGDDAPLVVDTPMSPPEWALLERQLLEANTVACEEFFARYFDDRGWLLCVERWGGDDGPDDAIENCNDWPQLHALGAPDVVLQMYKKAWEGHLRQFTLAKTKDVDFAGDGMYYKEFPVMFDWQHNAEGLTVFNLQGLSDPEDVAFGHRVRRYAGFYMNEDPGAPNYDPEHKVIKSLFNGSRGPLLRKATALDWAGDPIEVENRFTLLHSERTFQEMLDHFEDYTEIIGDHPLNLLATTLALNAYMLSGDQKYRDWLLEYVGAWRDRMEANGGVVPSNIGLDGTIGGAADGKWYGGTYGWAFSVRVPQTGGTDHRNRAAAAFVGLMNAYMLTKDDRWLAAWRKQADVINSHGKMIDGKFAAPRMYGDQGWYHFVPGKYADHALETYYLSWKSEDRQRVGDTGWLQYLEGKNANYPVRALRGDLERVRDRVVAMRGDTSTPDTRLSDNPMPYNPASVNALVELMLGGINIGRLATVQHCRLRYFDPVARRAGIPEDVAALVDSISDDSVSVTLVNVHQSEPRTLIVQAGGYAEHEFTSLKLGDHPQPVDGTQFTLRLEPGCGTRLTLGMQRYAQQPTMAFPWTR